MLSLLRNYIVNIFKLRSLVDSGKGIEIEKSLILTEKVSITAIFHGAIRGYRPINIG